MIIVKLHRVMRFNIVVKYTSAINTLTTVLNFLKFTGTGTMRNACKNLNAEMFVYKKKMIHSRNLCVVIIANCDVTIELTLLIT